jgi:N-formylglutamate deformylase
MIPVEVHRGTGPVVLGFPHTGVHVPPDIAAALNTCGNTLADTDWHIEKLYADLLPDVTTVRATFNRYVIDANRDPEGNSLYPGQNTTDLVPLTSFNGQPIWNEVPSTSEIERRREKFHAPYHAALETEMQRVAKLNGIAVLYDCHSIRSHIPFLFHGVLPDFNIGTNRGTTCSSAFEKLVFDLCGKAPGFTAILNGRFKGGWTTRHYGRPAENWHAIQMELSQSTYLEHETAPWTYDTGKAEKLQFHLRNILKSLHDLAIHTGNIK